MWISWDGTGWRSPKAGLCGKGRARLCLARLGGGAGGDTAGPTENSGAEHGSIQEVTGVELQIRRPKATSREAATRLERRGDGGAEHESVQVEGTELEGEGNAD